MGSSGEELGDDGRADPIYREALSGPSRLEGRL
jgi:hypothetical protein